MTDIAANAVRVPRLSWAILAVTLGGLLLSFFGYYAPTAVAIPHAGLDPSWAQAAVHAFLNDRSFGTQFIWTAGPLSMLYHRFFAGEAMLIAVLVRSSAAIYAAACLTLLTLRRDGASWPAAAAILIISSLAAGFMTADALLLWLPFLTAALELSQRRSSLLLAIGIALAACFSLSKFSIAPLSVGAFVLVDVVRITRRQLPFALVLYALLLFAFFVVSGQSPWDFIPFLASSVDVTRGYSSAMGIPGPSVELASWLLSAIALLAIVVLGEVAALRKGRIGPAVAFARVALVAGYLFVLFKAGFVRHDLHSLIAWSGLFLAAIAMGTPALNDTARRWRSVASLCGAAVLASAGITYALARGASPEHAIAGSALGGYRQLVQLAAIAPRPFDWIEGLETETRAAYARMLDGTPLPPLSGTVDSIPSLQALLIAAEALDPAVSYRGRPSVQEYAAYTPNLIARDRAFFEGEDAPRHLLFAPGTIDERHPASAAGALWPVFLARYDTGESTGDIVVLNRRDEPRPVSESDAADRTIGFGEEVPLAPDPRPIFLRVEIEPSLLGKLAEALYRPPFAYLTVTYADGSAERYRVIPGMIGEGMIISPTLRTAADYAALSADAATARLPRPISFRLHTLGDWAYEPELQVRMSNLELEDAAQ